MRSARILGFTEVVGATAIFGAAAVSAGKLDATEEVDRWFIWGEVFPLALPFASGGGVGEALPSVGFFTNLKKVLG